LSLPSFLFSRCSDAPKKARTTLLPSPFCFFSSCNATKKATFVAQNGCMGLVFVVLLWRTWRQ
jgi:hypothetical protein